MKTARFRVATAFSVALILPWLLTACATGTPPAPSSHAASAAPVPAAWQTPLPTGSVPGPGGLPHGGQLAGLRQWWTQLNDPLLVELIDAAQAASPTVAAARSRMAQARATRVGAGAALGPTLDASASAARGTTQPTGPGPLPVATTLQGGLQAGWETDLFGGNAAARDAAQARLEGAQAQWHDARVSVAAEVANTYIALRTCERLVGVAQNDSASRAETARLSDLSAKAGFTAPGTAALARASAAEANARLTQQRAQCELDRKALVALSGLPEPDLKQKAARVPAPWPYEATLSIASVPAEALAQRPDVFSAERDVAAASADVGQADAQRYPRLSLSGSVGALQLRSGGVSSDFTTWSIGPLALSLPLWDGGRRSANVDAARARYDEAAALYRAKVRQAVREVEEALVNLQSSAARGSDAATAATGYRDSFTATEARYKGGLASLVELEDARRTALAAETALLQLQRERIAAWIALYRSTGGGWSATDPMTPPVAAR